MSKRYPPEAREKALRLALDHLDEYSSAHAAAHAIGPTIELTEFNTQALARLAGQHDEITRLRAAALGRTPRERHAWC